MNFEDSELDVEEGIFPEMWSISTLFPEKVTKTKSFQIQHQFSNSEVLLLDGKVVHVDFQQELTNWKTIGKVLNSLVESRKFFTWKPEQRNRLNLDASHIAEVIVYMHISRQIAISFIREPFDMVL